METNRIRQFCVVAEVENLRKAAQMLHMTHGALSKSLQILALDLNKELFIKSGRGIVLSDEGKKFYPKALEFLKAEDLLLSKEVENDYSFSIGTFEVFSTYFFTKEIASEFSNKFRLKEYLPGELEKALINDEISMGITYSIIPTKGLEALKIASCEMSLYGRNELMKKHTIHDVPFVAPVVPIRSTISGVKGLDGWPDDKMPRNKTYEVDMLETALQLSSHGKAIGFFPKFLIKYFNQTTIQKYKLEELPLPTQAKKIKRDIFILIKHGKSEDKFIKKMARIIRNAVKE